MFSRWNRRGDEKDSKTPVIILPVLTRGIKCSLLLCRDQVVLNPKMFFISKCIAICAVHAPIWLGNGFRKVSLELLRRTVCSNDDFEAFGSSSGSEVAFFPPVGFTHGVDAFICDKAGIVQAFHGDTRSRAIPLEDLDVDRNVGCEGKAAKITCVVEYRPKNIPGSVAAESHGAMGSLPKFIIALAEGVLEAMKSIDDLDEAPGRVKSKKLDYAQRTGAAAPHRLKRANDEYNEQAKYEQHSNEQQILKE